MKVVIPLAGAGTRMRPFTHTKPKPLLRIAGKPAMDYIIDELKKLDVSEIIFITGHLKEKIEDHVKTHYDFKCRFIEQKVRDGTGGAIKLAEPYIDEPILIIFVDTLFDTDLNIIKTLKEDGIIWAAETDDPKRFGIIETKGNLMVGVEEKPDNPKTNLANIGMHYAKDYKLMFQCIEELYKKDMRTKGEFCLTDALQLMIDKGSKIRVEKVKGWYDCGKPETTLQTNQHYLKKRNKIIKTKNSVIIEPVFIEEGAVIENSIIGPYVSVAANTSIKHSIICNSIIDQNVNLEQVKLHNSIIGENVEIRDVMKQLHMGDDSVIIYKNEDTSQG